MNALSSIITPPAFNALTYARDKVFLWQSSPVMGAFNDSAYPFVRDPLLTLDDILCKALVLYGPTQSFKTVFLQIALAYLLDMRRKSVLAVAQTDDDADDFARIKLIPFLERIWSLVSTTKKGRSGKTLASWLWANHELIISGPGSNAQESKSVAYLITDEAHRYCVSNPGALTSLRNRMGDRWDRMEIHGTTAADAGTEIDILYGEGQQSEWHLACPLCHEMIWPLWKDPSRKHYNGVEVFQWTDSQSATATLDSIMMVCPHCDRELPDTRHNRIAMDEGAKYIAMNPTADASVRSYRWNAFAPRWKPHRDMLAKYLSAIQSAKMGELEPYKAWVTKQEVRAWTGEYPMLGDSTRGRNYSLGEIQQEPETLLTMTIDQQEGKGGSGFHLWCGIDRWDKQGNSHRIAYERKATYEDAKAMQIAVGVKDENTAIDYGQGMREREIFDVCARFHWLALKSGDDESFSHIIMRPGQACQVIALPYSASFLESSQVGLSSQKTILPPRTRGGSVPKGFCIARMWSKPKLYAIFYALKEGNTGKAYNVAKDMPQVYLDQYHAYVPREALDKPTGTVRKVIWRKVATDDHAWVVSVQNMLMAILAGYFPLNSSIVIDTVKASAP